MGEVAKLIVNNIETMDNEKEQDIQRKVNLNVSRLCGNCDNISVKQ